ncbi:MAG TPA: hypothetical protein VHF92_08655 [Geodermatophilus sp.]|nr:hypothetical protein [Geodermatophilus sp.]
MTAPVHDLLEQSRAALRLGDAATARRLLSRVDGEARSRDVRDVAGTVSPVEFFAPENVARILGMTHAA